MEVRPRHIDWKRSLKLVATVFASVLCLALAALHIPRVQTTVVNHLLDSAAPLAPSRLVISGVSGSPFHRMTFSNVRLFTPDSTTTVTIDTITVGLNPLRLLGNTLRLGSAEAIGITFGIGTRPDDSLILPLPDSPNSDSPDSDSPDSDSPDSDAEPFSKQFALDAFNVRRVSGRLTSGDSTLFRLDSLHFSGRDLRLSDEPSVKLDTLTAAFAVGSDTPGRLSMSGGVNRDGSLGINGALTTPRSAVTITGTGRYEASTPSPLGDLDIHASASPLAMRDLKPFIPALDASRTLALSLDAAGTPDSLTVESHVEDDLGGRLTLNSRLITLPDTVSVMLRSEITDVQTGRFVDREANLPRIASSSIDVEMGGTNWRLLKGTATLSAADLYAGVVRVDTAELNATLEDGLAEFGMTAEVRDPSATAPARVELFGESRPIDEAPWISFRGDYDNLTSDLIQTSPAVGNERTGSSAAGNNNPTGSPSVGEAIPGKAPFARPTPLRLSGSIEGRFDMDSTGTTGTLISALSDARLGSCDDVGGQLRVDMTSTRISANLGLSPCRTGFLSGDAEPANTPSVGALSIGATLDRLDPNQPWTLVASTRNLNLTPYLGNLNPPEREISVSGFIDASGMLPPGAPPAIEAKIKLYDLKFGSARVDSLTGTVSGTPELLDVSGKLSHDTGYLTADAALELDPGLRILIERAELSDLYVADLIGLTDQTVVLNGAIAGELAAPPQSNLPVADLTLDLERTRVNDLLFSELTGTVRAAGDSLVTRLKARAPGIGLDVHGRLRAAQDTLWAASGTLSFTNLDLGRLAGKETLSSSLTGTARADLDPDRDDELAAELQVDPGSSLNNFTIETLTARLRGGDERYAGDIQILGSDPRQADDPHPALDPRQADDPHPALDPPQADDPHPALDPHEAGEKRPVGAGSLRGGNGAALSFGYSGTRLFLSGVARKLRIHELMGDTTNVLLGSADLVVNATRDSSGWSGGVVEIDSLSGQWNQFDVERGFVRADLTHDDLRVDSLSIRGPFGRLDARGTTPVTAHGAASDLSFQLVIDGTASSIPYVRDQGLAFAHVQVDGSMTGPFRRRRIITSVESDGLRYGDFGVTSIDGRLLAELDEKSEPSSAELTLDSGVLDLSMLQAQSMSATVAYDGDDLAADLELTIDDHRNLSAAATWIRGGEPPVLLISQLRAQLRDDFWELAGPGRIVLGDPMRIESLVWISGTQRIGISSSDRTGTLQHLATVNDFQIESVADLFGFHGLGGTLSGVFTTGRADTRITMQGNIESSLTAFGEDVGVATAGLSILDTGVQVQGAMTHRTGKTITVSGTVPPDGNQESLRLKADADGFPVGWVRAFVDPDLVDALSGQLEGRLEISGSTNAPRWSGNLALRDGRIGLPELGKRGRGLVYSGIRADLSFEGDSLRVTDFYARSGGGRLRGAGAIGLTRLDLGQYNLTFDADNFLAVDSESYRAVAQGSGRLRGTTSRPVLSGDILIPSADFFLTDETTADAFEPVTLSDEDLRTLWERFGVRISAADTSAYDFYRVMAIENLRVRLERDTWVRSASNPRMDIQITGDLDVRKEAGSDESSVFGTIDVLPERSRIIQFGRRFKLTAGTLTFNGPVDEPAMDLEAEYDVPSRGTNATEVTIRLLVSGTPSDLEVEFDSDPTMELGDIVSYIATGRPASESLQIRQGQSSSYLGSAAGIAIGQVRDLVQNLAGESLGLDVIEIRQGGAEGLTLTAGKYVTPEFYVSVSQPLSITGSSERTGASSEASTQVAMEYEIVRQLLLSLMNRGTILRVTLRWEYAF